LQYTATKSSASRLSAMFAAVTLASFMSFAPASGATVPSEAPPSIVKVLRDVSYLAPLNGVTLTETQKSQIASIEKSGWTKLIPQIGTVIRTHEQIIGELAKPSVSIVAIKALEKQKAAALVSIEVQRIEMAASVHSLLTPDQIAQEAATHRRQVAAIEAWIKNFLGK